jgi:hypothetical protein
MSTQFCCFRHWRGLLLAVGLLGTLLCGTDPALAQVSHLENPDPSPAVSPATNASVSYYRFQNGQWALTEGNPPLPLSSIATASRMGSKSSLANSTQGAGPWTPIQQPAAVTAQRNNNPIPVSPTNAVKAAPVLPARSNPAKPFPKIKIQGVYYRTTNPSVMINGEMLFQGGWQGKVQVVSITKSNVVLEADGEQQVFKTD